MIAALGEFLHQIPADLHVDRAAKSESRDDAADSGRAADQPVLPDKRPAIGPRDGTGRRGAIINIQA